MIDSTAKALNSETRRQEVIANRKEALMMWPDKGISPSSNRIANIFLTNYKSFWYTCSMLEGSKKLVLRRRYLRRKVIRTLMNQEDIVTRATSKGVRFIIDVIKGAHDIYHNSANYGPSAIRDHTASVAAACINCHMIKLAEHMSVSEGMMGLIQIRRKRRRTTFILADYTEVWYKKLDKEGKPSFRISRQALEYTAAPVEQPILDMEMPQLRKRLVAGYRPVGAGIKYEILVTGPQEDGKWWEVRLSDEELPELFPAPAPEAVPDTTTEVIKKRVQVRKPKKSKADGDESDIQSV